MNDNAAFERVQTMKELILNEAESMKEEMLEEAYQQASEKKNRVFGRLREGLISQFKTREEKRETAVATDRSRRINQARLTVQEKRNNLLMDLQEEVKEKLLESLKDKTVYKNMMRELIVQGLAKLLETKVKVRCREQDKDLVRSIIDDANDEFTKFLKEKTGKQVKLDLTLMEKPLEKGDCELGGIILYCYNNKIIFRNTLDSRLELCFQDSYPDIRAIIFTQKEEAGDLAE